MSIIFVLAVFVVLFGAIPQPTHAGFFDTMTNWRNRVFDTLEIPSLFSGFFYDTLFKLQDGHYAAIRLARIEQEVAAVSVSPPPPPAFAQASEEQAISSDQASASVTEITRVREVVERREVFVPVDMSSLRAEIEASGLTLRNYTDAGVNGALARIAAVSGREDSQNRKIDHTNKIDQLYAITLKGGATMTSGSFAIDSGNLTVSGLVTTSRMTASGLITGDTLSVVGVGTSTSIQALQATVISILSTTATSTFGNGIQLSNGCFKLVNGNCAADGGVTGTIINNGTANRLTYYSAANTLDSANFLTVDTTNSLIGIGTTSPAGQFAIEMGANSFPMWIGDQGSTSPSFVITGGGIVGIGTSSPATTHKLHIFNASGDAITRMEGASTNSAYINFRDAAGANANAFLGTENSTGGNIVSGASAYSMVLATANARSIHLGTNNSTRLTVDSSGNVGIGTTDPRQVLTVIGNGLFSGDLALNGNDIALGTGTATTTISGGFGIGVGTTTPGAAFAVATSTAGLNTAMLLSNLGSGYTFWAQDEANDTTPFVIQADGNVGVGTTTPGSILSVQGVGNFLAGTSTIYSALQFPVLNATSTTATSTFANGLQFSGGNIRLSSDLCAGFANGGTLNTDASGNLICEDDDGASATINSGTANRLAFYSGATTLDSADFLGVFATGPAPRLGIGTSTPFAALSINASSSPQFMMSGTHTDPTKIPHWFASTTLGNLSWGVINNFNAGTSTYLTIASSTGSFGLGTTTPAARLSVAGNTYLDSNLITISSSSAADLTISYQSFATSTVINNRVNVWSIATSTTITPIFTIDTTNGGRIGIATTVPMGLFSLRQPAINTNAMIQATRFTDDYTGNTNLATSTFFLRYDDTSNRASELHGTSSLLFAVDARGAMTINHGTSSPILVAGLNLSTTIANAVAVAGQYAYVGLNSISTGEFRVIDISDKSTPVEVGSLDFSTALSSIVVSGRYAYAAQAASPNDLYIIDISDPTRPVKVSTMPFPSAVSKIAISGHYLYAGMTAAANEFRVIDVSNPSAPVLMGVFDTGTVGINDLAIAGRYAYLAVASAAALEFTILDISNPSAPVRAGTLDFPTAANTIAVSGRYAYIGTAGNNDDRVHVIDVSNPSSPTRVGSIAFPADVQTITISGRYAYVGIASDPNALRIIDISTPSRPVQASHYSSATAIGGIAVSGRYAYIANGDTDEFSIVDLGGAEISSLLAHSLEAGSLQVQTTARVAQNLSVDGALNVGVGGIFSNGMVGISLPATTTKFSTQTSLLTLTHGTSTWEGTGLHMDFATTTSGFGSLPSFTGNFLKFDRASTTKFIVNTDGAIGIGSTTAGSFLSIQGGNAQITGTTTSHALVATSTLFVGAQGNLFNVMQSGFVGIGTTSPGSLLSVSGSSGFGLVNTGTGSTFYAYDDANNPTDTTPFMIDAEGNVGIGSTTPGTVLGVNGAISLLLSGTVTTNGVCHTGGNTDVADSTVGRQLVACSGAPADIAEWYATESDVEAGDIVAPSSTLLAYEAQGADPHTGTVVSLGSQEMTILKRADAEDTVLGIISTAPFQTFGSDIRAASSSTQPVALNGRIYVKVNDEGGAIQSGDRIALSKVAGVGMKATASGTTVGIALEPFDQKEGKILIFINLGYAKLDGAATAQATNAAPTTNAWSVDQATGKVNVSFFGDINLQGNAILDVRKMSGYLGKWSIDEEGTLMAVKVISDEIITKKLKTQTAIFGSPEKPEGITIYDKTTTDAYCMYVDQGAIRAVKGSCEDSSSVPPAQNEQALPPPPPPTDLSSETSASAEDQESKEVTPPAQTSQESSLPAPKSSPEPSESASVLLPLLGSPLSEESEELPSNSDNSEVTSPTPEIQ